MLFRNYRARPKWAGGAGLYRRPRKRRNDNKILFRYCMLRTRLYYFRIFSIIDNRLCISRLIIDNQNFNTPLQSGTHHAPHRRNTVSGWRQLGLQCTVPGRCSRRRGRGKTDGRRHCWRCCGGKIKQRVHTIYCIHLTNRPADHHGRLDYLGGLTCISISWRHAACGFSQETAGGRVVSVRQTRLSHAVVIGKQRTCGRVM